MMGQTLLVVGLFVAVLAMLPLAIKWMQRRTLGGSDVVSAARLVSALAVGPQQRVVTVEVGPDGGRVWLVLGVTGQSITCLYSAPAGGSAAPSASVLPIAQDGVGNG